GLSFFYWSLRSEIIRVPLTSTDVPYAFSEITADFQDVTVQGELTYRIVDPERVAGILDFSVDSRSRYRSDDPTKLSDRLIHPAQTLTRTFTHRLPLQDLLLKTAELSTHVLDGLRQSEVVGELGTEVISFNVLSIAPAPDMTKAIQAESRESLLRRADEAAYARRNAAVEMERQIKENELNTEIAVAQKRRTVLETEMAGQISVEQQRAELVESRVANQRKESEAQADALKAVVDAIKDADWKTLMAATGNMDPRLNIAIAFRELAERAENIGNLNITPDLLEHLMHRGGNPPIHRAQSKKNE
ncbi:MAG: SPFH domain-containing protein, partial [Phycisphaerales bacterium]|nr:SPFH domain-containing protein [Phycisphaerales bacterium]